MEPGQPRQRLDQRGRLGLRGGQIPGERHRHDEYAEFSCTYARDRSLVQMVADSTPAFRLTVTVTSRPVRSTVDRSSAAAPPLHTQTPLTATSSWSGSNAASVVPTAARIRPQLGSLPNSAVFTRLLRDTARPTVTASASVAAPLTSMAMSLVDPSASASSCAARSRQAAVTDAASASAGGVTPE